MTPSNTVDGLADRLRLTLDPRPTRVLVGWGVGGVVAESLAARLTRPPRHTILLDSVAPGVAPRPTDADLLRSYAMLVGARRGRRSPSIPRRTGSTSSSSTCASRLADRRAARRHDRRRSARATSSTRARASSTTG